MATPLFALGVLVTFTSVVLSLPGVFDAVGGVAKWVARGVLAVAALLGGYSAVHGASLSSLRASLEDRIAGRLRSRWLPDERAQSRAGQHDG